MSYSPPEIARLVVVAFVETKLVAKKLVEVALVVVDLKKFAPVEKRLVEDANVANNVVEVEFVIVSLKA